MQITILGVHPVDAEEPCHLIECEARIVTAPLDFADFTQEVPGVPQADWQVAYDERFLVADGATELDPQSPDQQPPSDSLRFVFFFHYLEVDRDLSSPVGPLSLPAPTPRPPRLNFVEYDPP